MLATMRHANPMPNESIRIEKDGPVARLTLLRETIDLAVLGELRTACESLASDEDVRVVVLASEGDDFCLGWDGSLLAGEGPGVGVDPFGCLAEMPRPVVCAVQGRALSAGLELALACDGRVAEEGASLGLPEVGQGRLPMGGGTQRLPRLVGRGKALEMILSGEPIDAAEALRAGLVSRVAAKGKALEAANEVAGRIAERGPLAVRYAKEAVSRGLEMTLEQALRYETDLTVILQTTEDRAEGVRAFLEKRAPKFKGR
jgi:enoyl-CoA hydratase